VYRELGLRRTAYPEGELVQALAVELRRRGLGVRVEVPVVRRYRERRVGEGAVDLVVEGEGGGGGEAGAAADGRAPGATGGVPAGRGMAVGLLVNFGGEKPQWRRVYVAANDPTARRGDPTATEKPDGGR
jgi:hypothetical protein